MLKLAVHFVALLWWHAAFAWNISAVTVCLLKVNITIFKGTVPSIYKYHYNYYIYNYEGQPKRYAKQFVLLLTMYYEWMNLNESLSIAWLFAEPAVYEEWVTVPFSTALTHIL